MLDNRKGMLAVTTRHAASRYGRPICLSVCKEVVRDRDFLREFLETHCYSRKGFSALLGGKWTPRAVRSWLEGRRPIPTDVLLVIGDILQEERSALVKKRLPSLGGISMSALKELLSASDSKRSKPSS